MMGAVRKALFWAAVSLGVTLVPMYEMSYLPGLAVPLPYWIFAIFTSGGISFLVALFLVLQSERLRRANENLRAAQAQLRRAAECDHLTDLFNRPAFLKRVEAQRADAGGWMLLLDIDHFKTVNDRFGHETGDRVLQKVAGILQRSLRAGDIVGRLGGEEFGVYLPGACPDTATQIAERTRRNIETAAELADLGIALTVSIGLAEAARGTAISESLRKADFAMYGAKHDGRNRISLTARPVDAEALAHSAASRVSAA